MVSSLSSAVIGSIGGRLCARAGDDDAAPWSQSRLAGLQATRADQHIRTTAS